MKSLGKKRTKLLPLLNFSFLSLKYCNSLYLVKHKYLSKSAIITTVSIAIVKGGQVLVFRDKTLFHFDTSFCSGLFLESENIIVVPLLESYDFTLGANLFQLVN